MNSKLNGILALSLLAGTCFAQPGTTPANPSRQTPQLKLGGAPQAPLEKPSREDLSYAVGMMIGNNVKRANFDVDLDTISKAMKDVLTGQPTKFDEQKMQTVLQGAMAESQRQMAAKREKDAVDNKKKGADFLAENAKKAGVTTLPDGLQYRVLKEGTGPSPKANDIVKAQYTGKLIDGTKFDSSYDRPGAKPLERPANSLIKGWTEALQLMKVGSKWELYVPSELAYGERGASPKIGPNETLIFEMELVDFKPAEPPPAPPAPKTNESVVSGEIIKVPSAEEMKKGAKIEVIKQSDITNNVKSPTSPK